MVTRAPHPAAAEPGCASQSASVMLLSIWQDAHWHARVVLPDAAAHEFDSPFELARFLSRLPVRRCDEPAGGLR